MDSETPTTAINQSIPNKYTQLVSFDSDEKLICEIRKHPFGLFLVIISGLFVSLAILAVTIAVLKALDGNFLGDGSDLTGVKHIVGVVLFLLIVFSAIVTVVIAYLYQKNVVLITSDKVAEILYPSLFNKNITQFAIDDIQDVTVQKTGVFAHIFNYGTLIIETAGEKENLTFTYTPLAQKCAQQIMEIRESVIGRG